MALVLGIDPGTAITGYGIIEKTSSRLRPVTYGVVRTSADLPEPKRLKRIYDDLRRIVGEYRPGYAAIERLFFNKNVRTAMGVGQARGAAILAMVESGLDVAEYTPLQVKQAVTGEGGAGKGQVGYMVRLLLGLSEVPRPDDAADALAIAICHAHRYNSKIRDVLPEVR